MYPVNMFLSSSTLPWGVLWLYNKEQGLFGQFWWLFRAGSNVSANECLPSFQSAQINDYLGVAVLSLPVERNARQLGAFSRVNVGFENAPLGASSVLLADRVRDSFSMLDSSFLASLVQPGMLPAGCFPTFNGVKPS